MTLTGPGYPSTDAAFASAVKTGRELAKLTQDDVAFKMAERGFSFHQATVYKVEAGTRKVSIAEATALADILGLPLEMLIAGGATSLDAGVWRMVAEARELIQTEAKMMAALSHVQACQSDLALYVAQWERERPGETIREGITPREYFAPLLEWDALDGLRVTWEKALQDPEFVTLAAGIGVRVTELWDDLIEREDDRDLEERG